MALLGEIRNRSWILIVLIGVGMAGFIVMDMTSTPGGGGGMMNRTLATVNGEKITDKEINEYLDAYSNDTRIMEARRVSAFNQLVDVMVVHQEAEALGMTVTSKELIQLFTGTNPHPSVVRYFTGNGQRQFDPNMVTNYIQQVKNPPAGLAPEQQQMLLQEAENFKNLEKSIAESRLSQKYQNLITKGVYTPTWMAEMEHNMNQQRYNFEYVNVPLSTISNEEAQVSDADIEAYVEAHADEFDEKAKVTLEYTVFEVKASSEDTAAYFEKMQKFATDIQKMDDDSLFIVNKDGVENMVGTYDVIYRKRTQLQAPTELHDTIFSAPVGAVVGPYKELGMITFTKVLDRKTIPDSVRARHILLKQPSQQSYRTLDSIKQVVLDGKMPFDSIARIVSEDVGSAAKGGDLGYAGPGAMVENFNDYMFFIGEEDSLEIIQTQFGLHLIQITGRKFINNEKGVRLAKLSQRILPSRKTTEQVKRQANDFMIKYRTVEDMKKAALAENLTRAEVANLDYFSFEIVGLGSSSEASEAIKWAHNEDVPEGMVAERLYRFDNTQFNYTDKFAVVGVVNRTEDGLPTANDVRAQVLPILQNKKKAEILKGRMEGKDLAAVSREFNIPVSSVTDVMYGTSFIPEWGAQPEVLGALSQVKPGESVGPVAGKQGVAVMRLTAMTPAPPLANPAQVRSEFNNQGIQAIVGTIQDYLRKSADLEDNRRALNF